MAQRTYRYRCTAMGTSYVHETWRDHTPSARRTHIHGKLVSLHDEGRSENMTPARYGIVLLIGVFVLSVFACAAWGIG